MITLLTNLDRRWIFLAMALCVAVPILVIGLTGKTIPETPTPLAEAFFNEVDTAGESKGRRGHVLLAFDYDPASAGELSPMAISLVHQCAQRGLRMYFMSLWPVGPQMIDESISKVIDRHYPDLVYGEDYVNLGFKAGNEQVIKVMGIDLTTEFRTDTKGTPLQQIPMMKGMTSLEDFDLIAEISAGYPGTKEWVLYSATQYNIPMVSGMTGVQAPLMYPYYPGQLKGLLGAIKGAAEYESIVNVWVREQKFAEALVAGGMDEAKAQEVAAKLMDKPAQVSTWTESAEAADLDPKTKAELITIATAPIPGEFLEGQRRMGPQLFAHLLMVLLIILGNVVFFAQRRQGGRS